MVAEHCMGGRESEDGVGSGNWDTVAHLCIVCTLSLRGRTVLGSQLAPLPSECGDLFDDKMTAFRL